MNVDAEAAAMVRAATKPQRTQKRVRLCRYAGAFCAFCPDADSLPCVQAGGYWDCETCTASGCPCMKRPTSKRRVAYREWKEHLDAGNAKTRERRAKYGSRRWYANADKYFKGYSQGRTCAGADCEERITNANKSGFCKRCAALRRKGGGKSLDG